MPRLKAKYDHHTYKKTYPKKYLMDKSFNYPVEELARRNPNFARTLKTIAQQTRKKMINAKTQEQKQQIIQHSNQQVWSEVLKTLKK